MDNHPLSDVPSTNPTINDSSVEQVKSHYRQNESSHNSNHNTRFSTKNVILLISAVSIFILICIGHIKKFGYEITTDITPNISSNVLYKKDGPPLRIKTIVYNNKYITPRKIYLMPRSICLIDDNEVKEDMQLTSIYTVESVTPLAGKEDISGQVGQEVWIYPFSSVTITYLAKGDWYDYVYQYLDYDEINLVPTSFDNPTNGCENLDQSDIDKIKVLSDECDRCMSRTSANGPDISVVDFIANNNTIWENGYISFIPIIKNIGTEPTGPLEVTYYLRGKHSSSFQLPDLAPGEIINNFIAGSGFKGNFESETIKPQMDLRIEVKTLQKEDVDASNNTYDWTFNYSYTPLPKHNCTYTDNNQGPQDFYSASYIEYESKTYPDLCIDEYYLLEYLCDTHPVYEGDENIEVFLYDCPLGCNQGACNGEYVE